MWEYCEKETDLDEDIQMIYHARQDVYEYYQYDKVNCYPHLLTDRGWEHSLRVKYHSLVHEQEILGCGVYGPWIYW